MAEVKANVAGKLDFLRKFLGKKPDADPIAINQAWLETGQEGTISRSSVAKVRRELLRDGEPSSSPRPLADGPERPPFPVDQVGDATRRGGLIPEPLRSPETENRRRVLRELEEGLDRLLFRAMGLGDVPEVEEALQGVRRLVMLAALPCRPRVAVIGASTDRAKFGNKAVRAYARAGFEVYPIHPRADRVEGLRAYASLDELPVDRLDRVSLYVPAAVGLRILDQLATKRVGEVWLNPGADAPEVVERARVLGLDVVLACSILAVGEHPERL